MIHIFQQGIETNDTTLLLLHGTGGNEHDLIPLGKQIDQTASILSVRGSVLENGMPRFFRRIADGIFDEDDLIARTEELNNFITNASRKYNFNRHKVIAIGYSNGANIAASLLFHYENALRGAILHHPMVPRRGIELPNLSGKDILITAGKQDPMCPPEESEELHELLETAGANVETFWTDYGHQLIPAEVEAGKQWYEHKIK